VEAKHSESENHLMSVTFVEPRSRLVTTQDRWERLNAIGEGCCPMPYDPAFVIFNVSECLVIQEGHPSASKLFESLACLWHDRYRNSSPDLD
jgi:hypothetical protein